MAGNTLTLDFAGDATKLQKAAKQASSAVEDVGSSAKDAGEDFSKSEKSSATFTDKIGKLGAGISGMSDAVDQAGGLLSDFNQLQNAGYERAQKLARANVDVKQAQEDLNQALRDGSQAAIDADQAEVDLKQARLDQANALKAYNDAVKQHGRNSAEAQQASIDLAQAGVDVKQAQEDQAQATRDASQATIDAKTAQLDLNDAQREAHPTDLSKFADQLDSVTPLLQGLIGIVGLVTAAQWAWNAAQFASPTTWIVAGIVALIAVVVLLVKHWDKVKKAGAAAWGWIKTAASNTWDFLKKIPGWIGQAFAKIADVISWPYRKAFNLIADAWNNTIGRLSWTVPGWIPGIGGNTISVPNLPHFHTGGMVPGAPGSEMLAVLQAGERVIPASGSAAEMVHVVVTIDRDVLVDAYAKGTRRRFGHA